MKHSYLKVMTLTFALSALVVSSALLADAQVGSRKPGAPPIVQPKKGYHLNQTQQPKTGSTATLMARLIDPDAKAKQKTATVEVTVSRFLLIDPAKVGERVKAGQGHLHYQVDNGPVIATTATKLSFHELLPGQHRIMVMLVGNDHQPLGPSQTLNITIP